MRVSLLGAHDNRKGSASSLGTTFCLGANGAAPGPLRQARTLNGESAIAATGNASRQLLNRD
jgi:hypothetical protein